jgi:ATP-dependent DNA ligase
MACEGCKRDKTAQLSDGRAVCTWCWDWLVECEARHLLAMPLRERRAALQAREQQRSEDQMRTLKTAMARIHAQRRGQMTTATR